MAAAAAELATAPLLVKGGARGARRAARCWVAGTVLLTVAALVTGAALAPQRGESPGRELTLLLFVGSSAHVASTGWLFTRREVRRYAVSRPLRFLLAPALLVAGCAGTAALIPSGSFAWVLLPFFAWQFFHFEKQNLGVAALAARSFGLASLRASERRVIVVTGCAGIAGLMSRPSLLQLRVNPRLGVLFPVSEGAFFTAVALGVALLARRQRAERSLEYCAAYLSALVFFLPVFVFSSPYAAVGGMTVAHGLQYLLLLGLIAGGRDASRRGRAVGLVLFCNVALFGGIVLSVASHLHSGPAPERLVFGAYLGVLAAHFVVDAGLWRLRDAFPRAFVARHLPYLLPDV